MPPSLRVSHTRIASVLATLLPGLLAAQPTPPSTAEQAARQIQAPDAAVVAVWATEDQLANPVAISIDDRNRVHVAELHRINRGVAGPPNLLDDQTSRTVEDRLRMYERHAASRPGGMNWYREASDRIVVLEDTTGDGRADRSQVFADGFNDPLDGLGAGVLARDGTAWYANIPHLWRLRDTTGDGRADERIPLLSGFGVRVGYLGHDLHGLIQGPDGRLYFSIGDRGFHVTTQEGRVLSAPGRGAIFRCEPDGSALEVFFHGLRNPQELAFDAWGNLVTGDNNSDAGDQARVVYAIEGGDAGWEQSFQYLGGDYARGPWNAEHLWETAREDQPAWIVPPIGLLASGPCGLTHTPGTGHPAGLSHHFLLVDYLYSPARTVVHGFTLQSAGAGFTLANVHPFLRGVALTDLEFGPDGRLYLADFIEGGSGTGRGRIFTVSWPAELERPEAREAAALLARGFDNEPDAALVRLLAHPDQRIRLRAQWTLAGRGEAVAPLVNRIALTSDSRHARIHALWAIGQLARRNPSLLQPVGRLISDTDPEVRAQFARMAGDAVHLPAIPGLVSRITSDPSPRAQAHAAIALGKLHAPHAVEPLLDLLATNDNADPFLRHAAVMGLAGQPTPTLLTQLSHPSPAARLGLVVALRRRAVGPDARPVDPEAIDGLIRTLADPHPQVVLEAARAIHDLRLEAAYAALADLLLRYLAAPVEATAPPPPDQPATDTFTLEYFDGPTPAPIHDLRQLQLYRGTPTHAREVRILESDRDRADNYATRIRGWITAPQSGNYTFFVAADDRAEVWLGEDDSIFRTRRICQANQWTPPYAWDTHPAQVSAPIDLVKGRRYYVEVLHAEGGGQDHVAVGWQLPDGSFERPIGSGEDRGARAGEDPLFRRLVNVALRIGSPHLAARVAGTALHPALAPDRRSLALDALLNWAEPPPLDRVMGGHLPLPARPIGPLRDALTPVILRGLGAPEASIRSHATRLAEAFEVTTGREGLLSLFRDGNAPATDRLAALRSLTRAASPERQGLIDAALGDPSPVLRGEALGWWLQVDPDGARSRAIAALEDGTDPASVRGTLRALRRLPPSIAVPLLFPVVQQFDTQQLPRHLQAEFLDAVEAHRTEPPLNLWWDRHQRQRADAPPGLAYGYALEGGDALRGAEVFHNQPDAQCIRCHRIEDRGIGLAGPDLTGIGRQRDRAHILASIVDPNRDFTPGYETVEITLRDNSVVTGIVRGRTAEAIEVEIADEVGTGQPIRRSLPTPSIRSETRGRSAMPEGYGEVLSRSDLRDLVEYLATAGGGP